MHSLPSVTDRLYALDERNKQEITVEAGDRQLTSMLRLEMKDFLSSQQRAVDFLTANAQNGRGLPTELLSKYRDRMEAGWYETTLQKTLSSDEIVGLLNSEREPWESAWNREGVNHRENSCIPM